MKRYISLIAVTLAVLPALSQQYRPAVSILGDSYSTFEGYMTPQTNELWYYAKNDTVKTDVSQVEDTWWWQVISEGGYRLCVNNSYSGATVGYTGYNGNDYSDRSFLTRMTNLGCPDLLLIFGATNDNWCGEKLGDYKYSGWTKADFYTFRPAMACMLSELKRHYPNVPILFIINTDLKPEFVEACKTICRYYQVDYVQLHNIKKNYGHPTRQGMRSIAEQVLEHLKKMKI